MTNKEYYLKEFEKLGGENITVKFQSSNGDTKNLNVNADFLEAFSEWGKSFFQEKSQIDKYNISFDYKGEQFLVVEDLEDGIEYKIPVDLLHNGEIAEYDIVDRKGRIDELEGWIGETNSQSDKILMREDLATLLATDEEYVIGNYGTNGFITKENELEEFNKACEALISSYLEYEASQKNTGKIAELAGCGEQKQDLNS